MSYTTPVMINEDGYYDILNTDLADINAWYIVIHYKDCNGTEKSIEVKVAEAWIVVAPAFADNAEYCASLAVK